MSRHGFELKTNEQIILMRQAGLATAAGLDAIRKLIRAGITTLELDKAADDAIRAHGGHSNFQLVEGYKHTICASVNDEVVHGIPGNRVLQPGDIVSIDCGAEIGEWNGDSAVTFIVPGGDPEVAAKRQLLSDITEQSLWVGIAALAKAEHLNEVGTAIEEFILEKGEEHGRVGLGLDGHPLLRPRRRDRAGLNDEDRSAAANTGGAGRHRADDPLHVLGSAVVFGDSSPHLRQLEHGGVGLALRDHLVKEGVDVGFGDFGATGEDDEVRGVRDLRLVPGDGTELCADRGVGDDEELPRLEAVGGRGQAEGFLQGFPKRGRQSLRVKGLGGVAPVQGGEELGRLGRRSHGEQDSSHSGSHVKSRRRKHAVR